MKLKLKSNKMWNWKWKFAYADGRMEVPSVAPVESGVPGRGRLLLWQIGAGSGVGPRWRLVHLSGHQQRRLRLAWNRTARRLRLVRSSRFIHFVPLSNISPELSRSQPSISRKSSVAVALHVGWLFIVGSAHL